jgi:hypothetical protein
VKGGIRRRVRTRGEGRRVGGIVDDPQVETQDTEDTQTAEQVIIEIQAEEIIIGGMIGNLVQDLTQERRVEGITGGHKGVLLK